MDSSLYAICLVSHSVPKKLIKLMGPIILRTHRKVAEQDPASADQTYGMVTSDRETASFAQFWRGFIHFDDAIYIFQLTQKCRVGIKCVIGVSSLERCNGSLEPFFAQLKRKRPLVVERLT